MHELGVVKHVIKTLEEVAEENKVTKIGNGEGIIHGEDDVLSQGTSEMYRAR